MQYIDKQTIEQLLDYPSLIEALRIGFQEAPTVPPRLHYDFKNPKDKQENTLLLMPAWQEGESIGVKLVTVAPANQAYGLPSIQGIYILSDAITGELKAIMDAKTLTNWRTACASALAASFLAKKDTDTLFMIGCGSLAPYLIRAHAAIRPIKRVLLWSRDHKNATRLEIELNKDKNFAIHTVHAIEEGIAEAGILSCATLSPSPLILGKYLQPGQHIDLVGSYKPTMREADDEVILRSRVYVDTIAMAPKESGDLAIPIQEGTLRLHDIQGDLSTLCNGAAQGRVNDQEITVFKSVGHALEDLVAARLVFERWKKLS
ncbi:MAG: ornithine cyclodeaminase family protein [Flammeovirgaceae bacterium]